MTKQVRSLYWHLGKHVCWILAELATRLVLARLTVTMAGFSKCQLRYPTCHMASKPATGCLIRQPKILHDKEQGLPFYYEGIQSVH